MVIQIGIARDSRFNACESTETTEIIERPSGGESVVFCGGKRGKEKSKTISSTIVHNITEKIADGTRDSTAIRLVSDRIYHDYAGEASGDLCVFSVDFESRTLVISRCTSLPVYYSQRGVFSLWDSGEELIGSAKIIHPSITEIPIEEETVLVFLSRGVLAAGLSYGEESAVQETLRSVVEDDSGTPADYVADSLLRLALGLDRDTPQDDMTVIVVKIDKKTGKEAHRLWLSLPMPEYQSIFD